MVFNATFNNISAISWWLVVFVEETGGPGKKHRPVASHLQTLSHNVASSTPRHKRDYSSQEEFEDTKGVIRSRISTKNRQHNGQKKKYKRTNSDLQNIHIYNISSNRH